MGTDDQFRMTPQREVILEELERVDSHPTADEIYEMVRERLPRISLGTVYRNLETMAERGMIRKLEVAGRKKRFDGRAGEHYHVRCLECGRVGDIDRVRGLDALTRCRKLAGYQIKGYRLEFVGYCPACAGGS
jgi:Fur family ferric uptake transcriptional regulator